MDIVAAFHYVVQTAKDTFTPQQPALGPVEGVNVLIVGKDDADVHGDYTIVPQRQKTEDPSLALR